MHHMSICHPIIFLQWQQWYQWIHCTVSVYFYLHYYLVWLCSADTLLVEAFVYVSCEPLSYCLSFLPLLVIKMSIREAGITVSRMVALEMLLQPAGLQRCSAEMDPGS